MRKILYYLFYLILIMAFLFVAYRLGAFIQLEAKSSFNPRPLAIAKILISVLFGALLGLEFLLIQIKTPGKWKLNAAKFILIGIPSTLYVVLILIQMYIPINIYSAIYRGIFIELIPIVTGYILITSFIKNNGPKTI